MECTIVVYKVRGQAFGRRRYFDPVTYTSIKRSLDKRNNYPDAYSNRLKGIVPGLVIIPVNGEHSIIKALLNKVPTL
jgi:hypothetical protein